MKMKKLSQHHRCPVRKCCALWSGKVSLKTLISSIIPVRYHNACLEIFLEDTILEDRLGFFSFKSNQRVR